MHIHYSAYTLKCSYILEIATSPFARTFRLNVKSELSLIVTLASSIESEILNVVRMTRIPSIVNNKTN